MTTRSHCKCYFYVDLLRGMLTSACQALNVNNYMFFALEHWWKAQLKITTGEDRFWQDSPQDVTEQEAVAQNYEPPVPPPNP